MDTRRYLMPWPNILRRSPTDLVSLLKRISWTMNSEVSPIGRTLKTLSSLRDCFSAPICANVTGNKGRATGQSHHSMTYKPLDYRHLNIFRKLKQLFSCCLLSCGTFWNRRLWLVSTWLKIGQKYHLDTITCKHSQRETVTGQNGSGQNGTDKIVRTKW